MTSLLLTLAFNPGQNPLAGIEVMESRPTGASCDREISVRIPWRGLRSWRAFRSPATMAYARPVSQNPLAGIEVMESV